MFAPPGVRNLYLLITLSLSSIAFGQASDDSALSEPDSKTSEVGIVEEVVIIGSRIADFQVITQDTKKLVDLPGALGDPLAAVFSLPGVVYSGGEGGVPAVRGSSPQDNLFLVDFMPAGYIFHEFNTSVFHEYILQDFNLYSAGFGPEFSNVTGAVFDIRLRDPKNEPLTGAVDISMLRSGLFLEGGLTENTAFYVSGRKSLIHLFIPEGEEAEEGLVVEQAPQDDDYQAKVNWEIDNKNQLSFSLSGASDRAAAVFTQESDFVRSNPDFEGNAELISRYEGKNIIWDSYGDQGAHLKLGVGRMDRKQYVSWGAGYFHDYRIQRDTIKTQYTLPLGSQNRLTVGGQHLSDKTILELDQILFVCSESFEVDCLTSRHGRITGIFDLIRIEKSLYVNNAWQPISRFDLDIGLQWQHNDYTHEHFFNPRVSASYDLSNNWSINAKAGRYNRFPEIRTTLEEFGNRNIESPTADHYSVGISQELDDGWSWRMDTYYKEMLKLPLALKESDQNADLKYIAAVDGRAWGVDLFINKDITDNWYSWLSLSLSKSRRENTQTGQIVDYRLDTPVIFNWVLNYEPTSRFSIGWRWTIRSGRAYTPIAGVQENPYFEDSVLPEYGDPYSDRLPSYRRLDLRFRWLGSLWGMETEYVIDVINALNRKNVTGRGLDYDRVNEPGDDVAIEETQTPGIIPALGMRIKF